MDDKTAAYNQLNYKLYITTIGFCVLAVLLIWWWFWNDPSFAERAIIGVISGIAGGIGKLMVREFKDYFDC